MWENRIDGLRKLKSNAVPTLFGFKLEEHTKENNKRYKNYSVYSNVYNESTYDNWVYIYYFIIYI